VVSKSGLKNDSVGRTIHESFFDNDGHSIKDYTNKVYIIKTNYGINGLDTSVSYWKDSLTRMSRWNGIYEKRTRYNEDGQIIEYDYYDSSGLPKKSENGFSEGKLLYDEDGVMYERQYLFKDSLINSTKGIGVSSGFSIIRYERDSVGRVYKILFFGNDFNPINAIFQIHQIIFADRIDFFYKGPRIVEQWYYSNGKNKPFFKLDCIKNDYLSTSGISIGHKNASQ
jgi:hypothetical protein